jgi:hypothetical protein
MKEQKFAYFIIKNSIFFCNFSFKIRWFYDSSSLSLYSFFLWGGTESTRYCGHFWPIVKAPDDRWGWLLSNWWNEDWQGKPKYSEKTFPSATLSTTNPTWPDPGSNPGRRGGKSATNRLSYGAHFTVTKRFTKRFLVTRPSPGILTPLHHYV